MKNIKRKYSIIYADPAWTFKTFSEKGDGRSASKHYKVSSLQEMMDLPVANIAEEGSVLFMWATMPNLPEAFELGKAWGFTYKTCAFTWIKRNRIADSFFVGMGYYTRANAELCLLFTRGKPLERKSKSVRQVCDARIMRHSEKPAEIRDRIVELFGDLPRIELFSRERVAGWDAWGNEVDAIQQLKKEEWRQCYK